MERYACPTRLVEGASIDHNSRQAVDGTRLYSNRQYRMQRYSGHCVGLADDDDGDGFPSSVNNAYRV